MKNKRWNLVLFIGLGLMISSCNLPVLMENQDDIVVDQTSQLPTQSNQPIASETSEPGGTPTLLEDEITVLDRKIFVEVDDPLYGVEGVWPNLEGSEVLVDAFNNEIDQFIEAVLDDFLVALNDLSNEIQGEGEQPLSFLTFNYELTYSDRHLFSFYLTFDRYISLSAHPFPFSHALNYDAKNSQILNLEDLFLPGTDPVQEISIRLDPILKGRGFGYQEGIAAEVMRQRENWNLLLDGLQINFDVYEVAPYAAGPQHVLIPWEDLVDLIDPSGPAGSMMN